MIFLKIAVLLTLRAWATSVSGDFNATSQMGVGTFVPTATFEARMPAADHYACKISSGDGSPLFYLDRAGRAGVGLAYPQAALDVNGLESAIGLMLRSGNSTNTLNSVQIAFGLGSTETYRHSIRSRHNPQETRLNSIDFFLWKSTGEPAALGRHLALSLEALHSSSASVHVFPYGTPQAELEVSSGTVRGGGTIRYASASTESSRDLKTDIAALTLDDENAATADILALRHARFRYKDAAGRGSGPLRRGLMFEEAPESVRGPSQSISIDERLVNVELALKAAHRRIAVVEAAIQRLKDTKRSP